MVAFISNIEFYNTPEGDVMMKEFGQPAVVLKEADRPTIEHMLAVIRDRYPKAHARLMQLYSASTMNRWHYEFRVVHRFIRCNFGEGQISESTCPADAALFSQHDESLAL